MSYDDFIRSVQAKSGLDQGDAEQASQTVMDLLSQRLKPAEAGKLAAQLPAELAATLSAGAPTERRFSVNEFFEQISYSARIRQEDVLAVWATLREVASESELDQVKAQLPKTFTRLLD